MSDHLPILTLLRQTKLKNNIPLIFKSRNLNDKSIYSIDTALQQINWDDKLSGLNCNENYNIFTTLINTTMEKYSPLQKIRISSKQIYIKPWMSRGLEISSKKRTYFIRKHLDSTVLRRALQLTKSTGTYIIRQSAI